MWLARLSTRGRVTIPKEIPKKTSVGTGGSGDVCSKR